jgi:hypothetical protein
MKRSTKEPVSHTLEDLHQFATVRKGDTVAAEALMSFCRGECEHFFVQSYYQVVCDLCGEEMKP